MTHQSRELFVAIGVDCDPDRDAFPRELTWRGIEALPRLYGIPDVRWTFNIRADTQIAKYCGSAGYCRERFDAIWQQAVDSGSALAWHLHYFDQHGVQDVSEKNIVENIQVGSQALGSPEVVHMGWTFQNAFSLRHLAAVGVRIDYSPVPRMRFNGRGGVDSYDWSRFAYRPQYSHGIRMIPSYSYVDSVLSRRFGTERILLTTTTHPLLFRRLIDSFFKTGSDFLVSYFHADEIAGAVGGWRDNLYKFQHLQRNIDSLRLAAERHEYAIRFVTIPELAAILFDENRPSHA